MKIAVCIHYLSNAQGGQLTDIEAPPLYLARNCSRLIRVSIDERDNRRVVFLAIHGKEANFKEAKRVLMYEPYIYLCSYSSDKKHAGVLTREWLERLGDGETRPMAIQAVLVYCQRNSIRYLGNTIRHLKIANEHNNVLKLEKKIGQLNSCQIELPG